MVPWKTSKWQGHWGAVALRRGGSLNKPTQYIKAPKPPKQCPICGSMFDPPHGKQKYCSDICSKQAIATAAKDKYFERREGKVLQNKLDVLAGNKDKTRWETVTYKGLNYYQENAIGKMHIWIDSKYDGSGHVLYKLEIDKRDGTHLVIEEGVIPEASLWKEIFNLKVRANLWLKRQSGI